jgi:hypothetical protein
MKRISMVAAALLMSAQWPSHRVVEAAVAQEAAAAQEAGQAAAALAPEPPAHRAAPP